MRVLKAIENWFDIRPQELQRVVACVLGAFFLLAFVILARSIREGLFLTVFDATKLPYITAVVACLSLPTVGIFAELLGRFRPWIVLKRLKLCIGAGLAFLWIVSFHSQTTAVALYIWTILGAMLLTSGFWVLVAECFAVRSAKRLFGLIAGGGTAGAMVMGLSLSWITLRLELTQLIPILIGLLAILYVIELRIDRLSQNRRQVNDKSKDSAFGRAKNAAPKTNGHSSSGIFNIRENFGSLLKSPYLSAIASVVFIATVSSNIVDYQLKEYAQSSIEGSGNLTAFFGAFYGWTGGIALVIQLVFTAKIMTGAGVALGLAILPSLLLLGSSGFLIIPGLAMATLVRGGDNALRKSLLRPLLEFLYVPVNASIRRRTKLLIDSFVDSAGEGTGAVLVFIWVVLADGQSKYLSIPVIVLSLAMLVLCRHMKTRYKDTITSRLTEEDVAIADTKEAARLRNIHLLSASYSRLDIQNIIMEAGRPERPAMQESSAPPKESGAAYDKLKANAGEIDNLDVVSALQSQDEAVTLSVLKNTKSWTEEQIPLLVRLLARDNLHESAVQNLSQAGGAAIPILDKLLQDEDADFVIRRRIPGVLAGIGGVDAEKALFNALSARRFEIRYRTVIALTRLRKIGFDEPRDQWEPLVWDAIRKEVNYNRPVWEIRRLLDSQEPGENAGLAGKRVKARCELSLEHTFRMFTLVLDPEPVTAALHGIILDEEELKSFALEYLESALPTDISERLWFLIGDMSEYRKTRQARPLQQVVSDLMQSKATLFPGEMDRKALKEILE